MSRTGAYGFAFLFIVFVKSLDYAASTSLGIQKMLDFIWQDPSVKRRAKVAKRVKELCVDGDTPEETAVLMVAKEHNLMESQVKDLLGFLTPTNMKLAAKGGVLPAIIKLCQKTGWMRGK